MPNPLPPPLPVILSSELRSNLLAPALPPEIPQVADESGAEETPQHGQRDLEAGVRVFKDVLDGLPVVEDPGTDSLDGGFVVFWPGGGLAFGLWFVLNVFAMC